MGLLTARYASQKIDSSFFTAYNMSGLISYLDLLPDTMWRTSEMHSFRDTRGARGGVPRGWRGGHSYGPPTRGGWSGRAVPPALAASPEPPLGPLLSSLTTTTFDQEAKEYEPKSFIANVKTVASYNWLDRTEPTIIVPGRDSSHSLLSPFIPTRDLVN